MGCLPPPSRIPLSESGDYSTVVVGPDVPFISIRGYGEIDYAENGSKQTGSFDVEWAAPDSFNVHFYSPFGTILGKASANIDSGFITFDNKVHRVSLHQNLDSLFLLRGYGLQLYSLVILMTGRVLSEVVPDRRPDSSFILKKYRIQYWNNEGRTVKYFFSKDFRRLNRIVYNYKDGSETGYQIIFRSFREGFSRYISVSVDDRNYFSLKFEALRYKK
jgi:hypothetical protein